MEIWDDQAPGEAQVQSITQRVRSGNALPIVSHSAILDLALFGHESFVRYYAEKVGYPYSGVPDVGQIAGYDRHVNRASDVDCKEFYLRCLKNHILREASAAGADPEELAAARVQFGRVSASAFANLLGYPRFDQPRAMPLLVLADLPFKIYLTLSITTFLEDALRKAGKEPVTRMCRWVGPVDAPGQDLWQIPKGYDPTTKRPLVYHLCGLDAHPTTKALLPDSLALTQEDHLELLVNLAQDRGKDNTDRLPGIVRGALFDDVVLLGFSLDSWAFRALYFGVIKQTGERKDRRGLCCIQLPPAELEKKYVQGYLDHQARFEIFWGDIYQYAVELNPDLASKLSPRSPQQAADEMQP